MWGGWERGVGVGEAWVSGITCSPFASKQLAWASTFTMGTGPCTLRDFCELRFREEGLAFCSALGACAGLPATQVACIPEETFERAAAQARCQSHYWGRLPCDAQKKMIAWCWGLDPANRVRPGFADALPGEWSRQSASRPAHVVGQWLLRTARPLLAPAAVAESASTRSAYSV